MADTISWCRVCGKEYKVCSHCANVKNYTPWRTISDTAEHYKIWLIAEQCRKGIITVPEAKEQLNEVAFTAKEVKSFIPAIGDVVTEIMAYSEPEPEAAVEEPESTADTTATTKRKGRAK